MKLLWWSILSGILLVNCAGNRAQQEAVNSYQVHLNPMVKKWLDEDPKNDQETLPVLIVTSEPVKDYDYLTHVTETTYTAHVTRQQLRLLMEDKRVERISSGMKKLH